MKIGLVRHFKVDIKTNMWMTTASFKQWISAYDEQDVLIDPQVTIEKKYDLYMSSPLHRAIKTGEALVEETILTHEDLREVPLSPILKVNLLLPTLFWVVSSRVAWRVGHKSQVENHKTSLKRINRLIDELLQMDKDILIFSHGYTIKLISQELLKRGFRGPRIIRPRNGGHYQYTT